MKKIQNWWFNGPRQLWFDFITPREVKIERFLKPLLELEANIVSYDTVKKELKWASSLAKRAYGYTAYITTGRNPDHKEYTFDIAIRLGDHLCKKITVKCIHGRTWADSIEYTDGPIREVIIHLTRIYLEKRSNVAQQKCINAISKSKV